MASNDYYASWYERNKEALAKKRRERYLTDPSYRERVLHQSNRYRSGDRVVQETVELQGEQVPILPIMHMAEALGVERLTITNWEARSLFPMTPYIVTACNKRYYTQSMIDAAKEIVERRRNGAKRIRLGANDTSMCEEIAAAWRALGVNI